MKKKNQQQQTTTWYLYVINDLSLYITAWNESKWTETSKQTGKIRILRLKWRDELKHDWWSSFEIYNWNKLFGNVLSNARNRYINFQWAGLWFGSFRSSSIRNWFICLFLNQKNWWTWTRPATQTTTMLPDGKEIDTGHRMLLLNTIFSLCLWLLLTKEFFEEFLWSFCQF